MGGVEVDAEGLADQFDQGVGAQLRSRGDLELGEQLVLGDRGPEQFVGFGVDGLGDDLAGLAGEGPDQRGEPPMQSIKKSE